jgi:hypothetical protein
MFQFFKPTPTEIKELESLRLKIAKLEGESGSLSDYLDYGRPKPDEAARTEARMKALGEQAKQAKLKLDDVVTHYRANNPKALQEWVGLHSRVCKAILADPKLPQKVNERNRGVREMVTRQTLEAWEKVLNGGESFVRINWAWLPDYEERIQKET